MYNATPRFYLLESNFHQHIYITFQ